jgi:uncharacterized protein
MSDQSIQAGTAAEAGTTGPLLDDRTPAKLAMSAFFVLAFAWSWGIGFAAMQLQARHPALSTALMMVSGFGPSMAGIAVVAALSTLEEFRGWLARCLNWRIGRRWIAFAFALPPAVMLLALAIHSALGGAMPALTAADHIPMAIANFGLVLLIGGPLGEEFGWRGYAMPALADKLDWRAASLIIGVVWGLWHLPLFFMASTAQSHMPIPLFMLNILAGSVVFGWLFEQTKRSVLPALVLHTSLNAWAGILVIVPTATSGGSYAVVTGLLVLIALVLLLTADTKANVASLAADEESPP